MRYRDQVINKVEVLESTLKVLRQVVQRQEPIKSYLDTIDSYNGCISNKNVNSWRLYG